MRAKTRTKRYLMGSVAILAIVASALAAVVWHRSNRRIHDSPGNYPSLSGELILTIDSARGHEIPYSIRDSAGNVLIVDRLGNDTMRWAFAWDNSEDLWIYCDEGIYLVHRNSPLSMVREPVDMHVDTFKNMPPAFREYLPRSLIRLYEK